MKTRKIKIREQEIELLGMNNATYRLLPFTHKQLLLIVQAQEGSQEICTEQEGLILNGS